MENEVIHSKGTVYQLIPDTVFAEFNDHANSISFFKKFLKEKKGEALVSKFSEMAKGLMSTKKIVYKGNQKFEMEEILFADSSSISKRKTKYARKSNDHTAKVRVLN